MGIEQHDHPEVQQYETQDSLKKYAMHQEMNVDKVDNVDDEKSKHVTEHHFDNRYKNGIKELTAGPWFFWMWKKVNRERYNVFNHVDKNDDNKISVGEYIQWQHLLKPRVEEHVRENFVKDEQTEVDAILNNIDEEKYRMETAQIESSRGEIFDHTKNIIASNANNNIIAGNARNEIVAGNAVNVVATNGKTPEEYAATDPFAYAQEYIRQQNILRWVLA